MVLKKLMVMVPVYNEENILEDSITKLYNYLPSLEIPFEICIINSYSTDSTEEIAQSLADEMSEVRYLNLDLPGIGSKLKQATLQSDSEYFAAINVDLPVSLDEFGEIIRAVILGEADLVKGSKYIKGGKYNRPLKRTIASRTYNLLLRLMFGLKSTDAGVGVRAWNRAVKEEVWQKVNDEKWFSDVELLYYTQKLGYRVKEIPVTYKDVRQDSKFSLVQDGLGMSQCMLRFWLDNLTKKGD